MKKVLFLLGGLLSSVIINAQTLSYSDAAILFSSEENNGTARFSAMSGAFGALGGDLSAGDINPAGLAVFKDSETSISFGLRDTKINTSFFGTNFENNDNYFNLTQAGGVIIFDTNRYSNWNKIALGFNYSLVKDFENSWIADGNPVDQNGNVIAPLTDFYDPDAVYEFSQGQSFQNIMDGKNERFVFSLAAESDNNLYLGASINTHNLDFFQLSIIDEFNNDGNENTFDVRAAQEFELTGQGISFSAGAIIKPSQETRLGISFQSPTWYNLSERRTVFDDELFFNGEREFRSLEDSGDTFFDYDLRTPSKLTGSFAYVVGKEGLVSFDYTYKSFKNTKLKPTRDFVDENADFSNLLKNTSSFRIGGEWRLDNVSLRGGYHYEESPYEDATDSENVQGYSVGVGFKFGGNVKLDLAYQNSTNADIYNFLGIEGVEPAELDITNDRFTATLVIGL